MFDLGTVQRQHSEILNLAQDLLAFDTVQKVNDNAFNLSLQLAKLSGKLSIHLTGEDKFLYPFLMSKDDRSAQETSKRFSTEMGNLAQVFIDYKSKYLSANKITIAPISFIQETKVVMRAIIDRIAKEEISLYPLLKV